MFNNDATIRAQLGDILEAIESSEGLPLSTKTLDLTNVGDLLEIHDNPLKPTNQTPPVLENGLSGERIDGRRVRFRALPLFKRAEEEAKESEVGYKFPERSFGRSTSNDRWQPDGYKPQTPKASLSRPNFTDTSGVIFKPDRTNGLSGLQRLRLNPLNTPTTEETNEQKKILSPGSEALVKDIAFRLSKVLTTLNSRLPNLMYKFSVDTISAKLGVNEILEKEFSDLPVTGNENDDLLHLVRFPVALAEPRLVVKKSEMIALLAETILKKYTDFFDKNKTNINLQSAKLSASDISVLPVSLTEDVEFYGDTSREPTPVSDTPLKSELTPVRKIVAEKEKKEKWVNDLVESLLKTDYSGIKGADLDRSLFTDKNHELPILYTIRQQIENGLSNSKWSSKISAEEVFQLFVNKLKLTPIKKPIVSAITPNFSDAKPESQLSRIVREGKERVSLARLKEEAEESERSLAIKEIVKSLWFGDFSGLRGKDLSYDSLQNNGLPVRHNVFQRIERELDDRGLRSKELVEEIFDTFAVRVSKFEQAKMKKLKKEKLERHYNELQDVPVLDKDEYDEGQKRNGWWNKSSKKSQGPLVQVLSAQNNNTANTSNEDPKTDRNKIRTGYWTEAGDAIVDKEVEVERLLSRGIGEEGYGETPYQDELYFPPAKYVDQSDVIETTKNTKDRVVRKKARALSDVSIDLLRKVK